MKKPLSILVVSCLAAALGAQNTVTLPPAASGFEGSSSTGTLWSTTSATGLRQQMFYAKSSLPQGRLTITQLRWRVNGGTTVNAGGTWGAVNIDMSTSATPMSAISTTFASNTGTDNTNVYNGPVTVAANTPAFPGQWYVTVPLTTPFVFNNTGDLLIDVTITGGTYTGVTPVTTDYHIPAGTPAARLYATNTANATGSFNAAAGIVVELTYTVDPSSALTNVFGNGSYETMLYEFFHPAAAFDLSNSAIRFIPNGSSYIATSWPLTWFTPTSSPLALTNLDDGLSVQTLPFTFNYPGGTTTSVAGCTNGFVWLDGTQTSTDLSPSASEFTTQAPRLALAWTDMILNPTGLGGNATSAFHFDLDPSGTVAYYTWIDAGVYNYTATYGGPVQNTFQCALFSDGSIEFRYQNINNPHGQREMLTGIKPAAGTYADPGSTNLSAELPVHMVAGTTAGLRLLPMSTTPIVGTTVNLDLANIPATAVYSGWFLSFGTVPGVDMGGFGMPGCELYLQLGGEILIGTVVTNPTGTIAVPLPSAPSLVGYQAWVQGFSIVPGANALNAITSNALFAQLGIY